MDRPRRWWGSPRAVGVAGAVRSRVWECFIRTVFPRYPLENILNTWKFRYQSFQTRKSLALNDGAAGAAAQRPPCKRKNKSASGISLKKKGGLHASEKPSSKETASREAAPLVKRTF